MTQPVQRTGDWVSFYPTIGKCSIKVTNYYWFFTSSMHKNNIKIMFCGCCRTIANTPQECVYRLCQHRDNIWPKHHLNGCQWAHTPLHICKHITNQAYMYRSQTKPNYFTPDRKHQWNFGANVFDKSIEGDYIIDSTHVFFFLPRNTDWTTSTQPTGWADWLIDCLAGCLTGWLAEWIHICAFERNIQ